MLTLLVVVSSGAIAQVLSGTAFAVASGLLVTDFEKRIVFADSGSSNDFGFLAAGENEILLPKTF